MISNLPNNVLIHILSFLSTKNAIKTSILSTKWRHLWTYLSVFDFRISYPFRSYSLLYTVATLVHKSNHHHHLLEINRLTIHVPQVTLGAHKVTFLVTSLLSLKVQHLQFSIDDLNYLNTSCLLPRGFSASYSLSKLKLKHLSIQYVFKTDFWIIFSYDLFSTAIIFENLYPKFSYICNELL
jgi:hypothetical protein